MDQKIFEQAVTYLLNQEGYTHLTSESVAKRLGLNPEETERKLDLLVTEGMLDLDSDDEGHLFYYPLGQGPGGVFNGNPDVRIESSPQRQAPAPSRPMPPQGPMALPGTAAPQHYGPPQGYVAPQGYGPPQGYVAPQGTAAPQHYGSPQGYMAPQGYGPPPGYVAPQGYGPPQRYAPPQPYGPPPGHVASQHYGPPPGQPMHPPGPASPYATMTGPVPPGAWPPSGSLTPYVPAGQQGQYPATQGAWQPARRSPFAAAMLGIVPGAGQLYNGQIGKGVFLFLITVLLYSLYPISFLGLIPHVLGVVDGWNTARRSSYDMLPP